MKNQREQNLMNRLRLEGKLDLAEVVDFLNISESTARRLFARLESEGKIIRVHGGIQLPGNMGLEYSFEQVARSRIEEKNAIARRAFDLLSEEEIIFCDAGTTVLCFCMELAARIGERAEKIRVYTNSLANFEVLSPHVPITLVGGEYRPHRKDFSGYLAELSLSRLHFTKCFLGTDGCDMKQFFTTTDFDTARMDETAIRNSNETIILCDSGKFSSCAQIGYADFSDVDKIVTDTGTGRSVCGKLEAFGIEVIRAEMDTDRTGKDAE